LRIAWLLKECLQASLHTLFKPTKPPEIKRPT
jgi:hypothetical protein